MRKFLCSCLAAVLFMVPASLSAQKYDGGLVDKTIALVGNEAIFLSQIESEVQMMAANGHSVDMNTRCQVLENILVQKLLVNQAKLDSLTVNQDNVEMELEQRLAQIMTNLGGEKEVEKYFNKPMYKLKEEWRNLLGEQSLTQQMQQKIMQEAGNSTPSEVKAFYDRTDKTMLPQISTQYRLSQIVRYPDKEAAAMAAKEKLLEFRNRIIKGEKFSTLATLYSEDPGSMGRGGELGMASKSLYWPQFSDAAMALKEGQISQIVETPDGYHIIQMIEKDGDMFNVRHILLQPKYTSADRQKAFKTLDSIKHKIAVDSLDFDMAARFFSQDMKSAMSGGLMADEQSGATVFEKDLLKPVDYNVIKDMKEGEISDPFESRDNEGRSGNLIYKILRLEKILPSHVANFEQDFIVIQNIADQERQQKKLVEFIKEKQGSTYIKIDELFHKCRFEREGWIK